VIPSIKISRLKTWRMKKPISLLLPVVLALAVPGCSPTPEELAAQAQQAIETHQFNVARLHLGAALSEKPNDPQLLEMMARLQLQLGDGTGATAMLNRLDRAGGAPEDMAQLRAEAALLSGQFDEALSLIAGRNEAEAHRIRALAQVGKGDLAAAEQSFTAGASAPGDSSRLLADFALLRLRQGRLAEARTLADRALEAAPEGLDPLMAGARVAQASGQAGRALDLFAKANDLWPDSAGALLGRIGVLGDLGRLAEARPLIEHAATTMPESEDVVYLRARLKAEDGDWTQVRDILQPLEASDKIAVQMLYSRALLELEQFEQARGRLNALTRAIPQNGAVRRMLARSMIGSGEAGEAMTFLAPVARSVDATPEDLALYAEAARATGREDALDDALRAIPPAERIALQVAQADAALREGKWRTAIDAYERLRQWTGDRNVMVLNNLAYARSKAGETDAAIALARQALRLAPRNASVMDTLGWLLWESGKDRSEGLDLLNRAAQAAPDNPVIAEHLRRAQAPQA
jgi:Tfp pilus assembly protein PilF